MSHTRTLTLIFFYCRNTQALSAENVQTRTRLPSPTASQQPNEATRHSALIRSLIRIWAKSLNTPQRNRPQGQFHPLLYGSIKASPHVLYSGCKCPQTGTRRVVYITILSNATDACQHLSRLTSRAYGLLQDMMRMPHPVAYTSPATNSGWQPATQGVKIGVANRLRLLITQNSLATRLNTVPGDQERASTSAKDWLGTDANCCQAQRDGGNGRERAAAPRNSLGETHYTVHTSLGRGRR
ncbi:hypothetical protein E2C01_064366 [Portunus trituberculatus]|uniref:Uncharacterized protein n=1 Tax=Portunus trituberculatus TaxID=210409 RepID=A0A5B7HLL2_PORTR|nr:hypothetical protein [Portunus trituberculatus]